MYQLKQRLSYIILGRKGRKNRIDIIELLRKRPYNLNQISEVLTLNYRTVRHHIELLAKNEVVTSSKTGGYGEVYFLTPQMEDNLDVYDNLKKMLENIAESPAFLRNIIAQSHMAVLVVGNDYRTLFWNVSAERMFGYKDTDILGKVPSLFLEDRLLEQYIEDFKNDENLGEFDAVGKARSGENIDIGITIDRIIDSENSTMGYTFMMRDIGRRKKYERRIKHITSLVTSLKNLGQTMLQIPTLVILAETVSGELTDKWRCREATVAFLNENGTAIEPLAHSGDGEMGRWSMTPAGEGTAPPCVRKAITQGTRFVVEDISTCSECRLCINRSGYTSVLPIKFRDELVGVLVLIPDPTDGVFEHDDLPLQDELCNDLAMSRAAIVVNNDLKRLLARHELAEWAGDFGTWDWDLQSGELFLSDRAASLLGFEKNEFCGTHEEFLKYVHTDDVEHVKESRNACLESGDYSDIKYRILRPDRAPCRMRERGKVILNESGKAARMLGVVQVISERKYDRR